MRHLPDHENSRKTSHHSARETGAAKTNPRAKLPHRDFHLRTRRERAGLEDSFTLIALAIMVSDLLLLARSFQRAISGVPVKFRIPLSASALRPARELHYRRARPFRLSRLMDSIVRELEDLAFVICLALLPGQRTSGSGCRAIAMRARSKHRRHRGVILRLAGFTCMCLMAPRLALAEAPEVVTPIELFDPDSGEGVRISPGFVLYPSANVTLAYDSNIYNVDDRKTEDAIASFRPALALRSDFSRHAVSLEADADIRRYFDVSEENSEQYKINARSLLELGYGIDVNAFAGYARGIEQRGTAGDIFFTDEPVAFDDVRAGIDIARTGRRLELAIGGSVLKRDYSDALSGGIPLDLSPLDVTLRSAKIRADYGLNGKTKLFGELSGNEIDYQLPTSPTRDSRGFAVLLGVKHEVTALIDLEAGIGYIEQDFRNPAIGSTGDINYRLAAAWTPAPQWKLTASASRYFDASRSEESPAIIATEFRLGAQRAIGDRLLVGAEAGYLEESFRASEREDKRFFLSASSTYRLTDRIGIILGASYRDQDGGGFGRSYTGFAGSIGVRAAL